VTSVPASDLPPWLATSKASFGGQAVPAALLSSRMALDERDFFNSRNETRSDKLSCPRCKRVNEYQMRWVVRTRKDRIPNGADERDRAMFAKLRDYMIRVDDAVTCKTCGKKFDIPSQHSMVFIDKGAAAAGKVYTGGDDEDSRFNR
jgi:hypothetical protein